MRHAASCAASGISKGGHAASTGFCVVALVTSRMIRASGHGGFWSIGLIIFVSVAYWRSSEGSMVQKGSSSNAIQGQYVPPMYHVVPGRGLACSLPYNFCKVLESQGLLSPQQTIVLDLVGNSAVKDDKTKKTSAIPNILHFTFGMSGRDEPLPFAYFLNVLAAVRVLKPEKVFLHQNRILLFQSQRWLDQV